VIEMSLFTKILKKTLNENVDDFTKKLLTYYVEHKVKEDRWYESDYSQKEFFASNLAEGYSEMAVAAGPWIETKPRTPFMIDTKVDALFALYNGKGEVSTLEYFTVSSGNENITCRPVRQFYSEKGFKKYASEQKLNISKERFSLDSVVKNWGAW
jgi:hypothetical protein